MKNSLFWILIVLLLAGGFLRVFRLNQTLQFLGDQGRDALTVRKVLIDHDPVFIGPVTSVGNMYLGPAYYYFMLPFLALTYPSPMGPVYAVAILGTITIYLIFRCGRELVGEKAALIATVLYTFGWTFIVQSRFSWNPNPAPFVSILMIWATYRAWTRSSRYWILVSFCFSLLLQLHYMTLLSLPAAGIFWLATLYDYWKKQPKKLKLFFFHTLLAILLFLLSLTPLILFDFKHDFLNAKAFYNITFGKEDQVRNQTQILRTLEETMGRSRHILFEVTTNQIGWLNLIMVLGTFGCLMLLLKKKSKFSKGQLVITTWLVIGIVGTSLYKSSVFDHYIAYLYPVTCLIIGMVLTYCWQQKWLKLIVPAFLLWFFCVNLMKYDFKRISWTVQDIENYSKHVLDYVSEGDSYSLVGINSYHDIYAMNYRYYLTAWGKPPLDTQDVNSAKQLLIVNENYEPINEILDLPIYEIVIFPEKSKRQVFTFPSAPDLIILHR
ncbi:MAG: glycosyltransferase family 39 protein [Patescibacteria group bacterium]